MDQQKIIHLVGECVVVGGIFIYLHGQINSLKKEISELKEVSMKQQDYIEKNFIGIEKTLDYLMKKSTNEYEKYKPNNRVQNIDNPGLFNRKNKINVTQLPDNYDDDDDIPLSTCQQYEEKEIIKNSNKNTYMLNKTPTLSVSLIEGTEISVNKSKILGTVSSIDDIDDIKEELEELEELEENDASKNNIIVDTIIPEPKLSEFKLTPEKKVKKTKSTK